MGDLTTSGWTDADIERLLAPVARELAAPTSLSPLPYDLNAGVPDRASLPWRELAEAAARALEADPGGALTYGGTLGYEPLRAWIAERNAAETGLELNSSWVTLTSGSAHAIDNIAATFTAPGDVVVTGAPTYPGAIRTFRARGAEIVTVPQDGDGLEMGPLASALEAQRAAGRSVKLIYVVANYDNPTGATLPEERRIELARLAAEYRALIVEDDAYTGIDLDGPPPTSLFQIMGGEGILRVGTFSKTIATGLRSAWILATPRVIQALTYMRFDNGASPFVQRMIFEYLKTGAYDPHVARLQGIYRERRDAAVSALRERCDSFVTFEVPRGGFFLWLRLREGLEARALARAATEVGVAITPGQMYYAYEGGERNVRLVFSALPPEQLHDAITQLGRACAAARVTP
ncbi:MAG: PLP-dependent aminotransferase family protein [Dehalococcoidia bacterium]|nr:PLP-dependent aminotransferase family protein [Dehalococcoidia bacterium]